MILQSHTPLQCYAIATSKLGGYSMNSWHPQQSILPGMISICLASGSILLIANKADGQILPDATLGAESSWVNAGPVVDLIEGGATRGSALFHSFTDFNVNTGQQVYFANPTGIDNILSRVTGLNHSQIDGVLGVNGSANLFLINPNGIVFGPDATLDVEGAFLASTSDRFQFADGSEFRATNPNAAPLVNVNIPLGIQLGPDAPAALVNEADLAVGSDLTLVASSVTSTGSLAAPNGNIRVEGSSGNVQVQALEAQSAVLTASEHLILENSRLVTQGDLSLLAGETVRIRDSENTAFIAAAGEDLLVRGVEEVDIFALNHSDSILFSGRHLALQSSNPVIGDAHYLAYGNFRIEAMDGELGTLLSPNDPVIRASGDVSFSSYEGASLHILAGGSVNISGNVTITGADANGLVENDIVLSDGSEIDIDGTSQPTLDIRAGTTAFGTPGITGNDSGIFPAAPTQPQLESPPNADSGDIVIGSIFNNQANGRVFLTTQYSSNPGLTGGDIRITGDNTNSPISRPNESISAFGNPVTIDARGSVEVAENITSGAGGDAEGGNIRILSDNLVSISGSINSLSNNANAGSIRVNGQNGIATGNITARSNNNGDSGSITLTSTLGGVTVGSGFGSINSESTDGRASFVRIEAEQDIQVGSIRTSSDSFTVGDDGGAITIVSSNGTVSTGNLETSTASPDQNNLTDSGNVFVRGFGEVRTGAITTSAEGGDSGRVSITSEDSDIITNSIETSTTSGNARDITLTANQGSITANGEILSETDAGGAGDDEGSGNVSIVADQTITLNGITTQSDSGNGGDIIITSTNGEIDASNGDIRSDTASGNRSGSVTLTANQEVTTRNITTESAAGIGSSSGSITLTSTNSSIDTSLGELTSSTTGGGLFGGGTSENVVLTAAGDITTGNILTESDGGDSGQITLTSSNGGINTTQGVLTSRTSGGGFFGGDSADITLEALNTIRTGNVVTTSQGGSSGVIAITSFADGIDTTQGELTSETTGTSLFGTGVSADVRLQAETDVATGAITTRSAFGFSGDIVIGSDNGSIDTSGDLNSVAAGGDAAGDVTLAAATNVTTRDIFTQAINGNSGDINVTGGSNINTSQGLLESRTQGGTAGFVQLVSPGEIRVGDVNASTGSPDVAGAITIGDNSTAAVIIENSAIESTSSALGTGGNIVIQGGEVRLANAQVSAIASAGGVAGNVDIATGDLEVQDANITVDSPIGIAGNITIDADRVFLDGGQISARTGQSDANAANIFIEMSDDSTLSNILLLRNESKISATATGANADGGNIRIIGDFILTSPPAGSGNDIEANAGQGDGGVIDIKVIAAVGIQVRPKLTPLNDITASSEGGDQGDIIFDALATNLDGGLAELAFEFVDASDQALGQCSFDADTQASEIAVAGRGGLPIAPTAILGAIDNEDDWVTLDDVNRAVAAPQTVAENRLPGSAIARHPQALCHHAYQASQQS